MKAADFIKNRLPEFPNWITLPLMHLNRLGGRVYGKKMLEFQQSIPQIDPEQQIVEIANYAIAHVPYYRRLYGGKLIKDLEDFKQTFGLIDKDTVRDNYHDFISDEADKMPHVELRTSGTSGKPMPFLLPANRYIREMAFVTRIWNRSGWNYGIRGTIRRKQLPGNRDYMVNPATREIIFDGYRNDEPYIRKVHRVLKRNGVHTLYGYPSAIVSMVRQFLKYGLDTSFLHLALLTSEKVPQATCKLLCDQLGMKISTFYGHTEKLILIEQTDTTPTFAIEPGYGLAEIIDANGKEAMSGELVGSTLFNKVMPLLRYRTGDYATKSGEIRRIDGIEKVILSSIEGRREKCSVWRTDGSVQNIGSREIHDEYPLHADGIQFIQTEKGKLKVKVIPGAGYGDSDRQFMMQYYGKMMLGEENVEIEEVDELIYLPNGKAPTLISRFQTE